MPEMPRPRQLPKPAAAPTYQSVPEDTVANPTIDTPELPGAALAAWTPPVQAPTIDGRAVANRYMAVVLQLIERNKRYPDRARRFRIQGRVKVAFTITPEGGVEKLAVTRGARSEDLNTAAMEAVRRAAPFPRPPLEAFGGTPRVAVTIVFELS
jgi:protein TonB